MLKVNLIQFQADTPEETTVFGEALQRLMSGSLPGAEPLLGLTALPAASGTATLGDPDAPPALPAASAPRPLSGTERGPGGEAAVPLTSAGTAGVSPAEVAGGEPSVPASPVPPPRDRPPRKGRRVVGGAASHSDPARRPAKRGPATAGSPSAATPSNPHACPSPGCAFSSGTQAGLTRHRNQQHGEPATTAGKGAGAPGDASRGTPTKAAGAFVCAICLKTFARRGDLERHRTMAHTRHTPGTRTPRAPTLPDAPAFDPIEIPPLDDDADPLGGDEE